MSESQIKAGNIISILLAITGVILLFSSVSFGTSMADEWLMKQSDGIADTSRYQLVAKTYVDTFKIIGSVLLGAGFLVAILNYFVPLLLKKSGN